jgi:hypothetical protein
MRNVVVIDLFAPTTAVSSGSLKAKLSILCAVMSGIWFIKGLHFNTLGLGERLVDDRERPDGALRPARETRNCPALFPERRQRRTKSEFSGVQEYLESIGSLVDRSAFARMKSHRRHSNDQTFPSQHVCNSIDGDRCSSVRASARAGDKYLRALSSQRGDRNWICTVAAARLANRQSQYSWRHAICVICSPMEGRKRNRNHALVGAGSSSSADRIRCSRS